MSGIFSKHINKPHLIFTFLGDILFNANRGKLLLYREDRKTTSLK